MKKRKFTVVGMVLAVFMLFLVGCGANTASNMSTGEEEISIVEGEKLSVTGTLLLKVNPEIAIEYNEEGQVTRLSGKNDEGDEIVRSYNDYIGKDSGLVLEELIALIDEAGYFVEEVGGESRQIILELEAGSALPKEDFLDSLSMNIQTAVSNLNTEAKVVSEEEPVENENNKETKPEVKVEEKTAEQPKEQPAAQSKEQPAAQPKKQEKAKQKAAKTETKQAEYIGMERAKEIALQHAGKTAGQAVWDDLEFDIDDGVPHYEIEFDVGPNEYDYDIHAVSGQIIEFNHEVKAAQNRKRTKEQLPAQKQPTAVKEISREEAIQIALNHAGLSHADVVFDDVELDYEDGRKEWEIEFEQGNWEYEYEIDASNGNILDFEKELDD